MTVKTDVDKDWHEYLPDFNPDPGNQFKICMEMCKEALKKTNVLSGGEKVRCMLSKLMLSQANFLLVDESYFIGSKRNNSFPS